MQLQKGFPAFAPFRAICLRMGPPHFGHFGASMSREAISSRCSSRPNPSRIAFAPRKFAARKEEILVVTGEFFERTLRDIVEAEFRFPACSGA